MVAAERHAVQDIIRWNGGDITWGTNKAERDALAGGNKGVPACVPDLAMANALAVRPSQIDVDDPKIEETGYTIHKFQMRGRFAMRLADYRDEEGAVARLGGVRDAFNSPFRPFVLATTSVVALLVMASGGFSAGGVMSAVASAATRGAAAATRAVRPAGARP